MGGWKGRRGGWVVTKAKTKKQDNTNDRVHCIFSYVPFVVTIWTAKVGLHHNLLIRAPDQWLHHCSCSTCDHQPTEAYCRCTIISHQS